jgi:hypothetical protein
MTRVIADQRRALAMLATAGRERILLFYPWRRADVPDETVVDMTVKGRSVWIYGVGDRVRNDARGIDLGCRLRVQVRRRGDRALLCEAAAAQWRAV